MMPTFENTFGSVGAIIINGAILVVLFLFLVNNANKALFMVQKHYGLRVVITSLAILELLIILSMVNGVLFGGTTLIFRDFYELHKPVMFIFIVFFGFFIFSVDKIRERFSKVLLLSFIVISILAGFQLAQFNQFSLLYTGANVVNSNRLTVPFGNPYDFAFILVFFLFYFIVNFVYKRSIFYFIAIFLSSYFLIKTGSRSVFTSFVVVFLFVFPFVIYKLKLPIKIKTFFFFSFFFLLAVFTINIDTFINENPFLMGQFVQFFESGDIGSSAGERLKQFIFAMDKAADSIPIFLIGNGPSKYEMEHVESSYTFIFYRYGIVGFFIYLFIYLFIVFKLFKMVFKYLALYIEDKIILTSALLWFISMPISALGNMFIEQPKLSFFYYLIMGYILSIESIMPHKKS
jgi:hypothetical protein